MSALEQAMEAVLKNIQDMSQIQFNRRNQDITHHLSHLPTSQVLIRDAKTDETKLFAISIDESQARFHTDLMNEMQAIKNAESLPDPERLLSLATALNNISNAPHIEAKIGELEKKLKALQGEPSSSSVEGEKSLPPLNENKKSNQWTEEYRTLCQELQQEETKVTNNEASLQEKQAKLERLKFDTRRTRRLLLELQKPHHTPQLKQIQKQKPSSSHTSTKALHHQIAEDSRKRQRHLERMDQIKHQITTKKFELESISLPVSAPPKPSTKEYNISDTASPSPLHTSSGMVKQTMFDQLVVKINNVYKSSINNEAEDDSFNKELITVLELLIQALQNTESRNDKLPLLELQLARINEFRQQILNRAKEDRSAKQEALMTAALLFLDENGQIPLDELKEKTTQFATILDLDPSEGSQCIYSWVGRGVLTIDRSQQESYVKSNWQQ